MEEETKDDGMFVYSNLFRAWLGNRAAEPVPSRRGPDWKIAHLQSPRLLQLSLLYKSKYNTRNIKNMDSKKYNTCKNIYRLKESAIFLENLMIFSLRSSTRSRSSLQIVGAESTYSTVHTRFSTELIFISMFNDNE